MWEEIWARVDKDGSRCALNDHLGKQGVHGGLEQLRRKPVTVAGFVSPSLTMRWTTGFCGFTDAPAVCGLRPVCRARISFGAHPSPFISLKSG